MRTKTLHNGRDIRRVTTEERVMMTAGGTKELRGNNITMISVTPNYIGDESGLWVTEQHWAP